VIVIFVKMGALATCTFILFSDLGKILQSAVAYNVVSFGEFREKLCEENCTFFMGGFLFENRAVCQIMWENFCGTEQAPGDTMAHARRNAGYRGLHTLTYNK
jgi:hypothetical protein